MFQFLNPSQTSPYPPLHHAHKPQIRRFCGQPNWIHNQKSTDPLSPTFDSTPNWVICLGSKSDDDIVYWVDQLVMGELTDTGHILKMPPLPDPPVSTVQKRQKKVP